VNKDEYIKDSLADVMHCITGHTAINTTYLAMFHLPSELLQLDNWNKTRL